MQEVPARLVAERTMKRGSISPMRRLRIFEAAMGRCHICQHAIRGVTEPWDVEHVIPLALGGLDGDDNMRPAHKACHAGKSKTDVASIAKAKRMKARHIGIKKPSSF